jgi:hypothetical protein
MAIALRRRLISVARWLLAAMLFTQLAGVVQACVAPYHSAARAVAASVEPPCHEEENPLPANLCLSQCLGADQTLESLQAPAMPAPKDTAVLTLAAPPQGHSAVWTSSADLIRVPVPPPYLLHRQLRR